MGKTTWIRDGLHELRQFAQQEGLAESDRALRDAIVRVSLEAGIATKLPIRDLVAHQLEEEASSANAADACAAAD